MSKPLISSGKWRETVISEARKWRGTPYQHKGRVKGVGVDCGGLIYEVYNPIFGPLKPFPKNYAPDWALHRENEIYLEFMWEYVKPVMYLVPGGIAMFKVGRNFSHGAICTERNTYIHAWGRNQAGCVVESGLSFFRVGTTNGKPREVKYFDVDVSRWL